jgi:hypothetical protein
MVNFDLQTYLSEMEKRLTHKLDEQNVELAEIRSELKEVADLKVRMSVMERRGDALTKGLWTVATSLATALTTYIIHLWNHR